MDITNTGQHQSELTEKIKLKALSLGFLACGFAQAEKLEKDEPLLKNYLQNGYHGEMKYLENHFDLRLDPRLLVPGTKTVISLLYNYYTQKKQEDPSAPIISKYAFGKDYHKVIKKKLKLLTDYIKSLDNNIEGRFFVDSAPVLERRWAEKAGLGWIGKNGLLINKDYGSYFFISEILINKELDYNPQNKTNYCGQCTRCISTCPTGAIVAPGILEARRCISYLTIELKGEIPEEFKSNMENRVFGCDICQEACPFNKKSKIHNEPEFEPSEKLLLLKNNDWHLMDELYFEQLFKSSAVKRTGFNGLKRNLKFINPK